MIRVNGELINPNLFEEAFARIKAEAEMRNQASTCERDEEFNQMAEDEVIDSILIAQEAEKNHQSLNEQDVATRLEETITLYREHGATQEELEVEGENLRNEAIANLRIERFIRENLPEVPEPEQEEIARYYQLNQKEYRSLPEAHCLHLVKMIDGREDQRELLEEMTAIRERLLAGADFEEVAKVETEKLDGEVDLSWIPLDRPDNPFETILFSLRIGEISPVMSYEHALHLVKVIEKRGGEVPALEEVVDELKNRMVVEKKQAALRAFAETLRAGAEIERVSFS